VSPKPMKLAVACGACSLSAGRYADKISELLWTRCPELETMKTRIRPTRVLVAFFEALAISWALLYLGECFGWHCA
jgi:hypothetical protein